MQRMFSSAAIDAQIAAYAAEHVDDAHTPARLASVAEDAFARLAAVFAGRPRPSRTERGEQR